MAAKSNRLLRDRPPAVRASHRFELTKKTLQSQSRRLCLAAAISLGYRRRHMGDKEHCRIS
jgi:hypothetical protein